jgi:hypothetical protein
MRPFQIRTAPLAALALLAACSSDGNGPTTAGRQVAFQLATAERPAAGAQLLGPETVALGNDTIVFESVQLVLREIELERVGVVTCDTTLGGDDDDCEELELGPILLDLPLAAGADRQFTVTVDTGTFDEIEFEVHKPKGSDDAGFLALHPEFDGRSIKAVGTWNGVPFTFYSDLDAEQEYDLVPPLVVSDAAGTSVTLRIDLAAWFRNQAGDGLLDPATANKGGQFEDQVADNIEASIDVFEDHDHDGRDDHDHD